ncbi:DUF4340 domain-containing protein [Patescibacteria group bacterium]|nr:DUF4340 domain-containing protein [Patescibacteria group bacterium]
MKSKTLIIIIAVFIIGIGVYLFMNYSDSETESTADYSWPLFNQDEIDKIQVTAAGQTLDLIENAAGWTVNDKEVSSSSIDSLFNSMKEVTVTGPISTSGQNYDKFSLDEANAIDISLNSGSTETLRILIGKAASTSGSGETYFKLPDNVNVYKANKYWNAFVYKTADEWRDKMIWQFADGEVKKVTAEMNNKKYEAMPEGEEWQVTYNGVAKTAPGFINSISALQAKGFASEEVSVAYWLNFYGDNDEELLLLSVGEGDTDYYIKKQGSEDIYVVTDLIFARVWLPALFDSLE